MSDRKVYIEVRVRLVLRVDEGVEVAEIIDEMDYSFTDTTGKAQVDDSEVLDFEVKDSK